MKTEKEKQKFVEANIRLHKFMETLKISRAEKVAMLEFEKMETFRECED